MSQPTVHKPPTRPVSDKEEEMIEESADRLGRFLGPVSATGQPFDQMDRVLCVLLQETASGLDAAVTDVSFDYRTQSGYLVGIQTDFRFLYKDDIERKSEISLNIGQVE